MILGLNELKYDKPHLLFIFSATFHNLLLKSNSFRTYEVKLTVPSVAFIGPKVKIDKSQSCFSRFYISKLFSEALN